MTAPSSRRNFLRTSFLVVGTIPSILHARTKPEDPVVYPNFPAQDPVRVRKMVGVSHGVGVNRNDKLVINRLPEGANRPLYHLGNHEFHPAGAKTVRVRFTMENGTARALDVIDGPSVTQATRRI